MSVRDPFGFTSKDAEYPDTTRLVVYPRVLPLRALGIPSTEILGERRVKRQLFEDPLRIVTSREYVAGDPLNRIHWRATARQGILQTRVLESTSTPNVAVFLDVNTMTSRFQAPSERLLEAAVSVAASIASHAIASRYEVGVYVNEAYRGTRELIRFAPSRNRGHLTRVLTGLAHPMGWPLHSIDRMLATEGRAIPWTASILVVTAVPTAPLLGTLRRFTRAGRRVAIALVNNADVGAIPKDIPTFVGAAGRAGGPRRRAGGGDAMNRLYATLLVLAEVLWSYSVIVALTEWAWIGWERPPLTLPVAMLLAAAALVPCS